MMELEKAKAKATKKELNQKDLDLAKEKFI